MSRITRLFIVAVSSAWLSGSLVSASPSGYIYVAVPAAACAQVSPCAPPQVLVIDGATARQVTAIDLPVHTSPRGMAISRNGVHVYVSNAGVEFGAATSMTIIDARHHTLVATASLPADAFGELAVRANDSRVYITVAGGPRIDAFDTASRTIALSATLAANPTGPPRVAYSAATGDLYVLSGSLTRRSGDTLAEIATVSLGQPTGAIGASLDGTRIYATETDFDLSRVPLVQGNVDAFDATTLASLYQRRYGVFTVGDVAPVEVPGRDEVLLPSRDLAAAGVFIRVEGFTASNGVPTRTVLTPHGGSVSGKGFAVLPDASRGVLLTTVITTGRLDFLDLATSTWVAKLDLPRPASFIAATPPGVPSCSYLLDSHSASFTSSGSGRPFDPITGDARILLSTDCAWSVSDDAEWIGSSPSSGSGTHFLFISADRQVSQSPTRTGHIVAAGQEITVTQGGGRNPFGVIDTPALFATGLSGAVAVTGWAVDDLAVSRIPIYRERVAGESGTGLVYLGDATLVEGARPDVQAAYSTYPFASRAGWGYMLLTNMLPGGGNGTYVLWAMAEDLEGNLSTLGVRSFTASNIAALTPFGAIDTPGQGDMVAGTITNWGWALAPNGTIPIDGSTIDVVIDGVAVGHPTYGLNRPDVAALFPGYANTNSAVGYFTIDTTLMTNGVHTIAWVVRDSLGHAQGIGSRYFNVQNP